MYLYYRKFGKHPFDNLPAPDYFFLSRAHEEGLAHLYDLELLICYGERKIGINLDIIEDIR